MNKSYRWTSTKMKNCKLKFKIREDDAPQPNLVSSGARMHVIVFSFDRHERAVIFNHNVHSQSTTMALLTMTSVSADSLNPDKLEALAFVLDPEKLAALEEEQGAARVRATDVAEQHEHASGPIARCDGCGTSLRDKGAGSGLHANVLDQRCAACGYTTCLNCTETRIQGEPHPPPSTADIQLHHAGTCRCADANFGAPYCARRPEWYHGRNRSDPAADAGDIIARYAGDRHPEDEPDIREDCFEDAARACGSCGLAKRCLREAYRMKVEYKPGSATERMVFMSIST